MLSEHDRAIIHEQAQHESGLLPFAPSAMARAIEHLLEHAQAPAEQPAQWTPQLRQWVRFRAMHESAHPYQVVAIEGPLITLECGSAPKRVAFAADLEPLPPDPAPAEQCAPSADAVDPGSAFASGVTYGFRLAIEQAAAVCDEMWEQCKPGPGAFAVATCGVLIRARTVQEGR